MKVVCRFVAQKDHHMLRESRFHATCVSIFRTLPTWRVLDSALPGHPRGPVPRGGGGGVLGQESVHHRPEEGRSVLGRVVRAQLQGRLSTVMIGY